MEKITFTVTNLDANQRIDKYLKKQLPLAPASFIYRLFRLKDIKLNEQRVKLDHVIEKGDEITLYLSIQQKQQFMKDYTFHKVPLTANVVFENENILVVNKPRNLLVHSDVNENEKTLSNQVLTYLYQKQEFDPSQRGYIPSPVGRIDKQTSGLVVFAKRQVANQVLASVFHDNHLERVYLALVHGQTPAKSTIKLALTKNEKNRGLVVVDDEGKSAITHYQTLSYYHGVSLVKIFLKTGRSNQIRVHFNAIGHPILGDHKYGINDDIEYLCLHHYQLKFYNITGSLSDLSHRLFEAEIPDDINKIIEEKEVQ